MSKETGLFHRKEIIGTASILAVTGLIIAIQRQVVSTNNHVGSPAKPSDCTAEALAVTNKIQAISRLFSEMGNLAIAQKLPSPSENEDEARRKAKELYKDGTRLYDLGDFRGAAEKFTDGYGFVSDAAFLFNLGQCYRQMGKAAKAIFYYKRFLSRKPNAPNRLAVKQFIKELEALRQVPCSNASTVLQAAETLAVRELSCSSLRNEVNRFRTLFAQNCSLSQVPDTNPKTPESPVYQRAR